MRKVLFFVITLTLLGCNKAVKTPEQDYQVQEIEIKNDNEDLPSELVDSISFVALKENSQSYFTAISKMEIVGDRIFIFDKLGSNTLLEFNKDGDFVRSYGEHGHGSSEFLRLWDFDIDSEFVYLYDRQRQKMLWFDHNGQYVKSITTDYIGDGFKKIDNGSYLFSLAKGAKVAKGDNDPKLCIVDSDLKVKTIMQHFGSNETDDKVTDNLFHNAGKDIVYHKPLSDSVFVVSNDGKVQSCFIIDFKSERIPTDMMGSYEKLIENGGKKKYSYMYDCPLIAKNTMICPIFHKGNKATLIIDTSTHKSHITDWVDGVRLADIIMPVYSCDDYVVGWLDQEVFGAISDKQLVTPEMVKHLDNGGKILVYYHLRKR